MTIKIFSILLTQIIIICKCYNSLIRETEYGFIRGELKISEVNENIRYYSFMGVPFAQPPTGKLRFQEPVSPRPWYGIKNTTTHINACVQISDDFMGNEVIGNEDCLYLEISEPLTARNGSRRLMPVYVYIHGGTFISGSLNESGPIYFMEKPIVLVSLQYRLNVFGFLTTNDHYARGNVGLKDQYFALEWVHRNIRNFGGDPTRITIGGCSAGAASVHYQILSSKRPKPFHSAITHSGASLNRWALQRDPVKMVKRLAKGLGLSSRNHSELVSNLQDVDYQVLLRAAVNQSIVGPFLYFYMQPFSPVIEPKSRWSFIDESTYSTLQKGNFPDIPVLMGHVTEEGSFFYDYAVSGTFDINIYDIYPELIIPSSLNLPSYSICNDIVLNLIKYNYFENRSFTNKTNWINFMGQDLIVQGVLKAASFISRKSSPTYFYIFSFTSTSSLSYLGGVGHAEDLMYLFNHRSLPNKPETLNEKIMQQKMITLWTNFIFTGNPTPNPDLLLQNIVWPKFNETKFYLNIDQNFTIQQNPDEFDVGFWKYMFKICGHPPYYTY